jgi:CHASE3 domain sensor protein
LGARYHQNGGTIVRFKNVKLRTKILLGIGIPLILAVVLGVISMTSINTMIRTDEWVDHTYNEEKRI